MFCCPSLAPHDGDRPFPQNSYWQNKHHIGCRKIGHGPPNPQTKAIKKPKQSKNVHTPGFDNIYLHYNHSKFIAFYVDTQKLAPVSTLVGYDR